MHEVLGIIKNEALKKKGALNRVPVKSRTGAGYQAVIRTSEQHISMI